MGFLQRLGFTRSGAAEPGFVRRPAAQFAVDVPQELLEAMTGGGAIERRISRDEALQVPAVLRARNLIAGTLASLPHGVLDPQRRDVTTTYLLSGNIDPDIPNSVTFAQTYEDLLFEGIAWWRVLDVGWHGFPVAARHVPVNSVHVAPVGGLLPSQRQISPDQPFPPAGQVFIDGIPVPDSEIIRFDSPNPPLLTHAARAIRTALRLDRATSRYSENPVPLGYFTPKEGADPATDEEIQAVLDDWEEARQKRAWGFVNAALEAKTLQWNPEQLQLADQRQHAVLEIARAAGVDPEDLGVSTTSRTYQNSEQRRQDLLDFTLGPYVTAVQDRLSMRDIVPRHYITRINLDGFLRSDTLTRMQAYQIGKPLGAYTTEEIRELEDRPPLTSAQRRRVEQRTTPEETQMAHTDNGDGAAPDPVSVDFDADEDDVVRVQFTDDEVAETFQVDVDRRTITGLAVPWGKIAKAGFSKWRFAQDSLRWSDPSRVKLNLSHDFSQLVGRATRLQSGNRGLMATYKIARTRDGDEALSLAEDRVLDGLSVEIDFNDSEGDSWQPDPSDESVRLVRQASLRGTALTGMPAFDDARVTRVAATKDGGQGAMPDDKKPADGAGHDNSGTVALQADEFTKFMEGMATQVAESHKHLTEELSQSLGESLSAGIKATLENIHDPQRDGPEPVRAARFQVTREAPVYTFDGRGPSLVRDAWYAQREHDADAQERIRRFHNQSNEMQRLVSSHVAFQANTTQFSTVTTGTASEVIPPGYRPDLFVPQLEQGRPFVNALSRGTIANATPFVVPIFGSLTGGTGDHTEGQPPDEGTLVLGTKTVTPGAISGKLPLTREIVDSSNPGIDQIALNAMRESYARQTEQKTYQLLNGSNGQGGTITNGFVPSGAQVAEGVSGSSTDPNGEVLVRLVRRQLALYPFRRFAAPNRALMSQEATTAFVDAEDSTGRPLLPSVGAQNTSGLGNAVEQGWFVDGLAHVPAWAISGNTASDADIFTLNSMDAWAWESPVLAFRFEEKQGPEIIELALFGYFAVHLLRPVGLSAIRYQLAA